MTENSTGLRRRVLTSLALITAATLLIAGCAASGSNSNGTSTDNPSDEAASGGTLRIAVTGSANDTLDPHITPATQGDLVRAGNIYDGLTAFNHEGILENRLAESFEPNADATVWTLKIKKGVTFQDGSDLTAADVVFTIKRITDPANAARGAKSLAFIPVDGIAIVDDTTLTFTLKAPYGPFAELWASPYLYIVPEEFTPDQPIGTGPFKVDTFSPGQDSLLSRFDDYWAGPAKADALDIISFTDAQSALNALRGGQIDIASNVPYADAPTLEQEPGIKLLKNESQQFLPIYMRTDLAPFDNPKVREAMRLIVDRKEMIDNALNGYGRIANDMLGIAEKLPDVPQREQDIDRAKELLKEAGQSDLTIDLAVSNGVAGMAESAQVFAEQAAKAGVTVNVNSMDPPTYLAKYTEWPFGVDFFTTDHLGLIRLLMLPDASFNLAHWNDAEYVALSQQMFAEPDQAKRAELLTQMREIEYDRGGLIVWGWVTVPNAYSEKVQGLETDVNAKPFIRLITAYLEK